MKIYKERINMAKSKKVAKKPAKKVAKKPAKKVAKKPAKKCCCHCGCKKGKR